MEKFSIEKHYLWIKTAGSHPNDGYGPWNMHGKFCPNCGSQKGAFHLKDNRRDMIWNECDDCGWIGGENDTVDAGEAKNVKRTNLIDRIVKNDKNDISSLIYMDKLSYG